MENVRTIAEFAKQGGFVEIKSTVHESTENKYKFIVLLNAKNEATCVFFSKNASDMVTAGEEITRELLAKFQIADVTNADGEVRTKLISNSERKSLGDLL